MNQKLYVFLKEEEESPYETEFEYRDDYGIQEFEDWCIMEEQAWYANPESVLKTTLTCKLLPPKINAKYLRSK